MVALLADVDRAVEAANEPKATHVVVRVGHEADGKGPIADARIIISELLLVVVRVARLQAQRRSRVRATRRSTQARGLVQQRPVFLEDPLDVADSDPIHATL